MDLAADIGLTGLQLAGDVALVEPAIVGAAAYGAWRTARAARNYFLPYDKMAPRRKTFFRAPRQSGYVPKARQFIGPIQQKQVVRRVPRPLSKPGVVYANVYNLKEFTANANHTIVGRVIPADVLNCPKTARYLHLYTHCKIHSMAIEWITSGPTFIMSMYSPDNTTSQELEKYYERQPSMRLHRSDRNGKGGIISRTQSLGLKAGYQDYFRTEQLKNTVELAVNQCAIKFIAPNQYNTYSSGTAAQTPTRS